MSPDYTGNIPPTTQELLALYRKTQGKIFVYSPHNYKKLIDLWWGLVDKNTRQDIDRLKDMYDDMILYIDQYIGGLLQVLKDTNLLKNTVIILTSDHGEAFGEHQGLFRHGRTYLTCFKKNRFIKWKG